MSFSVRKKANGVPLCYDYKNFTLYGYLMNDSILNRMRVQIKKIYYTHTRYKVPATFAMLYHEKELTVIELSKFVRISDHLLKIDDNHYFITFSHTAHNEAFKASQNLILYLDSFFQNRTSCIAIDTFDTNNSQAIVYNRLMQILDVIRKMPYSRVEDENILDGYL